MVVLWRSLHLILEVARKAGSYTEEKKEKHHVLHEGNRA